MPIYMDVHTVPGVKSKDVAEAHCLDLFHQDEYSCRCMTYWIDEERESIFCLIEAPDKDAVSRRCFPLDQFNSRITLNNFFCVPFQLLRFFRSIGFYKYCFL